jgi:hypothetical protein
MTLKHWQEIENQRGVPLKFSAKTHLHMICLVKVSIDADDKIAGLAVLQASFWISSSTSKQLCKSPVIEVVF